jgi:hypothetical protein
MGITMLLTPTFSHGSIAFVYNSNIASASIRIEIRVAPDARVLQDAHPRELLALRGRTVEAEQFLIFSTNIETGFCLRLIATEAVASGWRLEHVGGDPVFIVPTAGGYRLCSDRNGRFSMRLKHVFERVDNAAIVWPVLTEISTL